MKNTLTILTVFVGLFYLIMPDMMGQNIIHPPGQVFCYKPLDSYSVKLLSSKPKDWYYNQNENHNYNESYNYNEDYKSRGNNYSELKGVTEIPATIEYNSKTYIVVSIGTNAFKDCTEMTSIRIPNSVTSIENSAFLKCTGLDSVIIPESVTIIEKYVFEGCTNLTSITIPNSVTHIGYRAFCGCSALTKITIPKNVTTIERSAFKECTGLDSVIIENPNLQFDFNEVFEGCIKLQPSNVIYK